MLFGLILSTSEGERPVMPSLTGMFRVHRTLSFARVIPGGLIALVPTVVLIVSLQRYSARGLTLSTAGR